jgi:hypothetical protein
MAETQTLSCDALPMLLASACGPEDGGNASHCNVYTHLPQRYPTFLFAHPHMLRIPFQLCTAKVVSV